MKSEIVLDKTYVKTEETIFPVLMRLKTSPKIIYLFTGSREGIMIVTDGSELNTLGRYNQNLLAPTTEFWEKLGPNESVVLTND